MKTLSLVFFAFLVTASVTSHADPSDVSLSRSFGESSNPFYNNAMTLPINPYMNILEATLYSLLPDELNVRPWSRARLTVALTNENKLAILYTIVDRISQVGFRSFDGLRVDPAVARMETFLLDQRELRPIVPLSSIYAGNLPAGSRQYTIFGKTILLKKLGNLVSNSNLPASAKGDLMNYIGSQSNRIMLRTSVFPEYYDQVTLALAYGSAVFGYGIESGIFWAVDSCSSLLSRIRGGPPPRP
jgi:hypothetical protein